MSFEEMAISCLVSEIKRDIGRKRQFLMPVSNATCMQRTNYAVARCLSVRLSVRLSHAEQILIFLLFFTIRYPTILVFRSLEIIEHCLNICRQFKCSLDYAKKSFFRSLNAIFGKIGRHCYHGSWLSRGNCGN